MLLVKSIDIIVLHRICIISLKLHFIPSHSIRVLCFPEKKGRVHHTSFIGANNWKFTFTITTRAASRAAEQQSGDQQRKVRAVVRVWSRDWPGSGALCPVITRDMESITNIAHQGKGKLDQNQQKQPVCSKTLGLPLTGARYLTSGLGMNCLVSGYLSEVWCYKVHFVLNLNGSHNTLPHWGWGMWTRLPSNRRRVEAGARQRASPASCSPLLSPSHTQHPELTPTAGDWSRSSHHLGLLPC